MKHQLDKNGSRCPSCGAVWLGRYPRQDGDDCPGDTSRARRDRLKEAVDEVCASTLIRGREALNIDWSLVAYEISRLVGKPCGVLLHNNTLLAYELPVADETL